MDASTRFLSDGILNKVIQHAYTRGLFISNTNGMMSQHLAVEALEYFGVEPCLMSSFKEMAGGFIAVHNSQVNHCLIFSLNDMTGGFITAHNTHVNYYLRSNFNEIAGDLIAVQNSQLRAS